MQRLASLTIGTSRFMRVASANYFHSGNLLVERDGSLLTTPVFAAKRSFASKKEQSVKSKKNVDVHAELYKVSTAKEETHVPDELHSGQPIETIESISKNPRATTGKVWSSQDSGSIHVASQNSRDGPKLTPKASAGGAKLHEPTVHSAQGHVQSGDTIKMETAPPATTAQMAEAAAASAFEPFPPGESLKSAPIPEAKFSPKISSVDTYSSASSPTAHFDSAVPGAAHQESKKYETSARGKVYGGQDTSASSKKHPKENPFNTHEKLPLPPTK